MTLFYGKIKKLIKFACYFITNQYEENNLFHSGGNVRMRFSIRPDALTA